MCDQQFCADGVGSDFLIGIDAAATEACYRLHMTIAHQVPQLVSDGGLDFCIIKVIHQSACDENMAIPKAVCGDDICRQNLDRNLPTTATSDKLLRERIKASLARIMRLKNTAVVGYPHIR